MIDIVLMMFVLLRIFGGVIIVEWFLDFFDLVIFVIIKLGENFLKIMKFIIFGFKIFEVSYGIIIIVRGKFIVVFNGGGLRGILIVDEFLWDING